MNDTALSIRWAAFTLYVANKT